MRGGRKGKDISVSLSLVLSFSYSNDRKSEELPRDGVCLRGIFKVVRLISSPAPALFWVHCQDSVCLGSDGSFREIVPREPERTRSDCVIIDSGNDETVAINFRSQRRLRLTKETGQPPRPPSPLPLPTLSSVPPFHPVPSIRPASFNPPISDVIIRCNSLADPRNVRHST